jgi:hypothetical protein
MSSAGDVSGEWWWLDAGICSEGHGVIQLCD